MFKTGSLYVALAIFGLGLVLKISTWFRHSIGDDAGKILPTTRMAAAGKGILATLLSRRIFKLLEVFVGDVLLQRRLLRHEFLSWFAHMCIFGGFMMLLVMHALSKFTTSVLFPSYQSTLNPFLFLRDLCGALVILGVALAIYRRFMRKLQRPPTSPMDCYALAIVALILVSGVLLEASKIGSYSLYQDMVAAYAGREDEATLSALEAYWVEEFAVVSPAVHGPFDSDTLTRGRALHEVSCIECHSHPRWAFLGYAAAQAMKPLALAADRADLSTILFYLHFLACWLGLAYLPFSKMFHIFSSPLSLMANAVMEKGRSHPANVATRQIIELDACTHCGACTQHCSVAVAFAEIPNVNILPSEKIASIKQLAAGKRLSASQLSTIQQGMHLCTNCYRCTAVCPVGINLQELWLSVREALLQKSLPEFLLLSPLALYRGLMQESLPPDRYRAPLDRAREAISAACNAEALQNPRLVLEPGSGKMPGGLSASLASNSFSSCYRCMTCTSACPVVRSYADPVQVLGLLPHQIMHAAGLRLWDLILGARMLWDCLGCYQCQEHCPMSVRTADIIYELKNLAIQSTIDRWSRKSGEKS